MGALGFPVSIAGPCLAMADGRWQTGPAQAAFRPARNSFSTKAFITPDNTLGTSTINRHVAMKPSTIFCSSNPFVILCESDKLTRMSTRALAHLKIVLVKGPDIVEAVFPVSWLVGKRLELTCLVHQTAS